MAKPGHCGYCNEPLSEDAVSAYFCSPGHQWLWHEERSEPLPGWSWVRQQRDARTTYPAWFVEY